MKKDRRNRSSSNTKELFRLSDKEIQTYIDQERRGDELDRLQIVHQQKQAWRITVGICFLLNILFLALALMGLFEQTLP